MDLGITVRDLKSGMDNLLGKFRLQINHLPGL